MVTVVEYYKNKTRVDWYRHHSKFVGWKQLFFAILSGHIDIKRLFKKNKSFVICFNSTFRILNLLSFYYESKSFISKRALFLYSFPKIPEKNRLKNTTFFLSIFQFFIHIFIYKHRNQFLKIGFLNILLIIIILLLFWWDDILSLISAEIQYQSC